MKWMFYWLCLIASLFGLLYWKNKRGYADETRNWYLGKSAIECVLIALSAAFLPALLIAYAVAWAIQKIQRPALKIGAAFIISTVLYMTVGWALELLILTGAFAINLISDDFLGALEDRRKKRDITVVPDGRTA